MPIKIAYLAGQLSLGGAEQQLYYLLSHLDRERFEPIVIGLGTNPNDYWARALDDINIPVFHCSPNLNIIAKLVQTVRYLAVAEIDLLHSWSFHTTPYAVIAGKYLGGKRVLSSLRFSPKSFRRPILWFRLAYYGIHGLVVNSRQAAEQIKTCRVTKAPVYIVPNGVKVPPLINQAAPVQKRIELGFAADDWLIGSIGRLDANKNQVMLVRVMAKLADQWPQLRLALIGSGPSKPLLDQMIAQMQLQDRIKLLGAIPKAAQYLPAFSVLGLTSYCEGMPNVVMEALAARVPVVAVNWGGIEELIEPGITGFWVKPDDDDQMAKYINQLLANSHMRENFGNAARNQMQTNYSIEKMVERFMNQVYAK